MVLIQAVTPVLNQTAIFNSCAVTSPAVSQEIGLSSSDPAMLVYLPQGASDTNWAHSLDDVGDVCLGYGAPVFEPHEAIIIPANRTAGTLAKRFFIVPTDAERFLEAYTPPAFRQKKDNLDKRGKANVIRQ